MLLFAGMMLACAAPAAAQAGLTQQQALRLAFPAPMQIERRTAYLKDGDVAQAMRLAGPGIEIRQRVVTYYAGSSGGVVAGVAYFDTHRVRTMNEVIMIVVSPLGTVERIEILKFSEPPEYRASERWLDQFDGKALRPELSLKRGIANMTGATLTSTAITRAVRRVLALNQVIQPFGREK